MVFIIAAIDFSCIILVRMNIAFMDAIDAEEIVDADEISEANWLASLTLAPRRHAMMIVVVLMA